MQERSIHYFKTIEFHTGRIVMSGSTECTEKFSKEIGVVVLIPYLVKHALLHSVVLHF